MSSEELCPGSVGLAAASGTLLGIPLGGLRLGRKSPSESAQEAAAKERVLSIGVGGRG